jgi:hypothetical protein
LSSEQSPIFSLQQLLGDKFSTLKTKEKGKMDFTVDSSQSAGERRLRGRPKGGNNKTKPS